MNVMGATAPPTWVQATLVQDSGVHSGKSSSLSDEASAQIRRQKRRMAMLKRTIVALGVVFLGGAAGFAQTTPTLSLAAGKVGISSNEAGAANNFEFYMEPSGYPRAVTAGETIFAMGSWPSGKNPTFTDEKSNTWAAVASCTDSASTTHGFFYAVDAAASTSIITHSYNSSIGNEVFDWAHFYNMSTISSDFVDGSSCKIGVTPSNNTVPNISGTAYTTATNGDLILICVYVEQGSLGSPNAISSITFPAGLTGLSEDATYGHSCAYGVQTTAGSFTPTFTVAQNTHNTFTIMSAAFKAGPGGSAPGSGASIALSEMFYNGSQNSSTKVYLPCPVGTTAVAVLDDAGNLTGVSDSSSSAWSHVSISGNDWGPLYYTNSPTITSSNSYTVTMTFGSSGGYDLVGLTCLVNTNGIDTAVTAQNGSTLNGAGSGSVYATGNVSGGTVTDVPSVLTSTANDLILDIGAMGEGPVDSCVAGYCVFDYVGSTNWTAGDNESYANGDLMAHAYAPTAGIVSFNFNVGAGTSSTASGISLAFKSASGGGGTNPPAPPTGLQATVQ
jgi:hypothetical protein